MMAGILTSGFISGEFPGDVFRLSLECQGSVMCRICRGMAHAVLICKVTCGWLAKET